MQWIRTAEPEIIKQVWIQAVEQKDSFWNNVHKFSPKPKLNIFGAMFFGAWGRDAPSAKGDPSCEGGIGTAGDVGRRPEGHMAMILIGFVGFCWLWSAVHYKNLSWTCFCCLQKGCDCPKWPWNATRGSTLVVSENFGGITKWRSWWWSRGHGDDDMTTWDVQTCDESSNESSSSKDVQTCDTCASSRSLFQTQYGSHGRELAEKQFYTKKVTAQYAFEESCNLGILILDHSCHSCHSCHSLFCCFTNFLEQQILEAPTQVLRMMCPKYQWKCLGSTDQFVETSSETLGLMADSAGGRKQPPALLTNNHPTTPTPPTPPTPTTTKPVTLPQARSNPMTQSSGEKNKSAIICYNLLSLIGCIWIASYWNDHSMWKTRLDYFKFQLLDFKDQQNLFHQVSFVWPRRMLRAYGKQHIGKRAANTFVEETLSGRTWYLKCRKIFKLLEFRVPQPAVAHLKEAPVPEIKRTSEISSNIQIFRSSQNTRL